MDTSKLTLVDSRALKAWLDSLTDEAKQALTDTISDASDGRLEAEELEARIEQFVRALVAKLGVLADVLIALPPGLEEASDVIIGMGVGALDKLAAEQTVRLVDAVDDLVGFKPARAARRLIRHLEADARDGIVGDDRVRRIERLATRLRAHPGVLTPVGLEVRQTGDGLLSLRIDGRPWSQPFAPRGGS